MNVHIAVHMITFADMGKIVQVTFLVQMCTVYTATAYDWIPILFIVKLLPNFGSWAEKVFNLDLPHSPTHPGKVSKWPN